MILGANTAIVSTSIYGQLESIFWGNIQITIYVFFIVFFVVELLSAKSYNSKLKKLQNELNSFPNKETAELKNLYCPSLQAERIVMSELPSLLKMPLPASSVAFAPSLLTALGVLGTFWGITSGLSGFKSDVLKGNSEETLTQVFGLVEGMKIAFNTSLIGLGAAALFMVVLGIAKARKKSTKQKVMASFDEAIATNNHQI